MKHTKKALCYILAIIFVLTAVPMGMFGNTIHASAEDSESKFLLNRPKAGISVTEVTRVAYATNTMKPPSGSNSMIVKATPSGIPYLSNYNSSKIYAGETPSATQISFTPGVTLDSAPTITCSNTTVKFSSYTLSNGTYTWSVTSGSATVGTSLIFTVNYSYSEINSVTQKEYSHTYQTQAVSYVESILVPAGIYSYMRTYENWGIGSTTKNRSYIGSLVLGKNVYGKLYNNGTGDGSLDFTKSWSTSFWTNEYGNMMYYSESGSSRQYNVSFEADANRPISYVYFDRSLNSTLSDINLRYCTYIPDTAAESDEQVTVSVDGLWTKSGVVKTFTDDSEEETLTSDTTPEKELGIIKYTGSVKTEGSYFTMNFSGNGLPNNNQTKDYTVAVRYRTAASWSGIFVGHSFSLKIMTYDKGALRNLIEDIQNNDPTTSSVDVATGEFKGYNPQSWYYESGYEDFLTALNDARSCLAEPDVNQTKINNAYNALNRAYGNLKLAKADYTYATSYYNQAIRKNRADYSIASWARLQTALDNYKADYSALYQPAVDKVAVDIKNALNSLEYQNADYSAVLLDLANVNRLIANSQFDYGLPAEQAYNNWSKLVSALENSGCVYNELDGYVIGEYLPVSQQSAVDGYALLIENALSQLSLKSADYTQAKAAENAYKALHLSYITDETVGDLTAAYNFLVSLHNLDLSHQTEIDYAVSELNMQFERIEYKPADISAAEELISYAYSIDPTLYSDFSPVERAIDNLIYKLDLDIRYQSEIDRYTSALRSAIDSLISNAADYSAVDEAIQRANDIAADILDRYEDTYGYTAADYYSNWSNLDNLINSVTRQLDATQQAIVDGYAASINSAIDSLTESTANYATVNELQSSVNLILNTPVISSLYTQESLNNVRNANLAVVPNLKISQQETVDGYAQALQIALDNLTYVTADYSGVNSALNYANDILDENEEFIAEHPGYSLYTDETIANLNLAMAAVEENLDINHQAEVTAFATNIQLAINSLEYGPADYDQVDIALLNVPEDLSDYTSLSVTTLNLTLNRIDRELTAEDQLTVDNYVTSINNAIKKLKYKAANYAQVDAAKARIPSDSSIYTQESWQILQDAVNAVETGLDITKQKTVDEYALAINTAVDYLVLKGADYSQVMLALDAVPKELDYYYTESTVKTLNDAIDAVVYSLDITKQEQVNGYAAAINSAITGLIYKPADYSFAQNAINAAEEKINTGYYTDESVQILRNAINAITPDLDMSKQSLINEQTENIVKATNELVLKPANYKDLQNIIDLLDNSGSEIYNIKYSNYSEVMSLISEYRTNTVSQNMNLTIDKQSIVDEMAETLQGYIDSLIPIDNVFEAKEGSSTVINTIDNTPYIYGINEGTSFNDFLSNCIYYENVEVVLENPNNVDYVGTGTKVKVYSLDHELIDEYTVIIFGDADGNGTADVFDLSVVKSISSGQLVADSAVQKLACDLVKNGEIDTFDLALLLTVASGKAVINQVIGEVI